jgi:hypothetical protein
MAFSLNGYLLSVATANNLAADDNDDGLMPATFQQWKGEYDDTQLPRRSTITSRSTQVTCGTSRAPTVEL